MYNKLILIVLNLMMFFCTSHAAGKKRVHGMILNMLKEPIQLRVGNKLYKIVKPDGEKRLCVSECLVCTQNRLERLPLAYSEDYFYTWVFYDEKIQKPNLCTIEHIQNRGQVEDIYTGEAHPVPESTRTYFDEKLALIEQWNSKK